MWPIVKGSNRYPAPGTPEFYYMALRGQIQGVTRQVVSGSNLDIHTATVPEDVWGGDGLIPFPSAGESLEITGGATDSSTGTGARTVSITTLDAGYVPTTQVVTLNGTTPVAIPGSHRVINSATVLTTGSGGKPSQPLVIQVAGGGAPRGYVGTEGVLNQARFTVPTGYRLDLHSALLGLRTEGTQAQSVVFTNVTTDPQGRQLAPLRIPVCVGGQNPYVHEIVSGLCPFNSIQAQHTVTTRVTIATSNSTQTDVAILCLLYDTSVWP